MTKIKVFFLIALLILALVVIWANTKPIEYVEATVVETVVEDRDNIQKLADNYAQSYRLLQEADMQLADATERQAHALKLYNEATEALNLYTK